MTTTSASTLTIVRNAAAATVLVLVLAAGICAAFDRHVLTTWVGFFFIAATPTQVILSMLWQARHPPFIARLPQPAKGLVLTAATALAGGVIGLLLFYFAGAGVSPPTPMLLMLAMVSVVTIIWLTVIWHCWPLSRLTSNQTILGVATLVAAYVTAVLVFRAAFDFSFMEHTPVYVAILDPKGLVSAWVALSVLVTTIAVTLVATLFDFWPLTKVLPTRRQPAFGIAVTASVVIGTTLLYGFSTYIGGLDPVELLVRVAVSLIYGIFLVNLMTGHQLLAHWDQPQRGVTLTAIAASLAVAMYAVYAHSAPFIARHTLAAGSPAYELEIWVANAMLGITFPLMVVLADFFEFWPLNRQPSR
jgi:hypothetical protein